MSRSERAMAARWALASIVVGALFMAGAVAGLRALEGAYVADQRDRSALVRSEGLEHPSTTMPGIHYQVAERVPAQGVGR